MRVVLSTWGSRGDVEPLAGLAVRLRELGAEVRVCAPPDEEFVALVARAGVPLVPLGPEVRSVVTATRPPTAIGRRWACRRWATSATTSSPSVRGWRPMRRCVRRGG
ncbi:glycosyltransferase [Spirillospora sp. CA-108201]